MSVLPAAGILPSLQLLQEVALLEEVIPPALCRPRPVLPRVLFERVFLLLA
jgi:hypothetical protein